MSVKGMYVLIIFVTAFYQVGFTFSHDIWYCALCVLAIRKCPLLRRRALGPPALFPNTILFISSRQSPHILVSHKVRF